MNCKNQAKGETQKAGRHFSHAIPRSKYAMRTLQGSASRNGFTLIEVLIAMTLLSIMVVLLFGSLRICAQSWEQGESKIAEVNEVAVVYNFFQRHLSSAMPLWNDFDGDSADAASQQGTTSSFGSGAAIENKGKNFSFQGKKNALQFVSAFPASAGRAGMQLFSLKPQQQDKEQVIKITLTPFFPVTEGEAWHQEEEVLLKHVRDFTLAYFGAADDTGKNSWQDEWLEKDVQPKLVKININTTDGVVWPEMIIELKVAGSIGAAGTAGAVGAGTGAIASPFGGGN